MTLLRILVGVLGAVLLGVVLWASFAGSSTHGSFLDQIGVVATLPWGITTFTDLYVGFALFAVVIFLAERSWLAATLWCLPLPFLGNFWAALWLVLRLPSLMRRLTRPDLPEA